MAAQYDIVLEEGATWTRTFTYEVPKGTPVDLTGDTCDLEIREKVDDAAALLTLSETAGITLGGVAGTMIVTITGTQTAALADLIENGVFDLLLTHDSVPIRLVEGIVRVKKAVTRPWEVTP
uniref:Uncharacterized protein n=1 Tax=viral metagenome TaxID=1070528 RepID=A0A6M3IEZ1_9ZZZZ